MDRRSELLAYFHGWDAIGRERGDYYPENLYFNSKCDDDVLSLFLRENLITMEAGNYRIGFVMTEAECKNVEDFKYYYEFIRGLIEDVAVFRYRRCEIPAAIFNEYFDVDSIIYEIESDKAVISGVNALDFMSKLYDNCGDLKSGRVYNEYLSWFHYNYVPKGKYILNRSVSVAPTKSRASDEGYDLTIVSVVKHISHNSCMYDTHVVLIPPPGFHYEILPRSSLSKSGYIFANSVGLIDESYSGTIKVCLIKVSDDLPNLILPFKAVQAVLRPSIHYTMEETLSFQKTERGEGGFGSTD